MIVSCPNCATRYNLPPTALGGAGRKVRCAKCGHNWVQPPGGGDEPAPAPPKAKPRPRKAAPASAADETLVRSPAPAPERTARPAPPPRIEDELVATRAPFGGGPVEEEVDWTAGRPSTSFQDFMGDEGASGRGGESGGRRWLSAATGLVRWLGFAAGVTGLVISVLNWRNDIVELWPAAARLYDAIGLPVEPPGAGLQLQNVKSEQRVEDGAVILVVEGQIANVSSEDREVPPVSAVSIGPDHKPVHRWRIPVTQSHLVPGAVATFHSAERDPGVVSEVAVTFDRE